MRRLTTRFVLLIASAAIAPLVLYGLVSILRLQAGTRETVTRGNIELATQVAERIGLYISHNTRVLRSVGLELGAVDLQEWQQTRVLKDYVLDFPEFTEITFFNAGGRVLATSRVDAATLAIPEAANISTQGTYIAPVQIDDDGLPRTTIAVRVMPAGREAAWVVGEIALEELWKYVDRIRVGREGYALVVSEQQRLIAHGNPDKKSHVAASNAPGQVKTPEHAFAARLLDAPNPDGITGEYRDENGRRAARGREVRQQSTVGRHHRTADRRGVRAGQQAPPPIAGDHRARAPRHGHPRLVLGTLLHHAHRRPDARDAGARRRSHGRARRRHRPRRDPPARRRVQLDGRPPGPAPGGRPAAGAAGDVRQDRRRSRPRPVPPHPDDRHQLEAHRPDVRRRGVSGHVQADDRAREPDHQARARGPAEHRAADPARALPRRHRSVRGRRRGVVEGACRDGGREPAGGARVGRRARPGRRVRARACLSQPAHQRDPGDVTGRTGGDRHRGHGRARPGPRLRHGLRHSAGPDWRHLR